MLPSSRSSVRSPAVILSESASEGSLSLYRLFYKSLEITGVANRNCCHPEERSDEGSAFSFGFDLRVPTLLP